MSEMTKHLASYQISLLVVPTFDGLSLEDALIGVRGFCKESVIDWVFLFAAEFLGRISAVLNL